MTRLYLSMLFLCLSTLAFAALPLNAAAQTVQPTVWISDSCEFTWTPPLDCSDGSPISNCPVNGYYFYVDDTRLTTADVPPVPLAIAGDITSATCTDLNFASQVATGEHAIELTAWTIVSMESERSEPLNFGLTRSAPGAPLTVSVVPQ